MHRFLIERQAGGTTLGEDARIARVLRQREEALHSGLSWPIAEALAFDFIGLDDDSALQRHVADHAARTGRRMRVRAKARSLDLVCRMVGAGAGLAVVPQAASRRGAAGPGLVLVPLTESWAERRLMLVVRRRDQLPPYAGRLLGYLLASAPPEASAAEARVRPGRSPSGSAAARSPRSTTP